MARKTYFENIQQNHRPSTLDPLLPHLFQQPVEPRIIPLDNLPHTEESHDPRTLGKRTEHDRDPTIFIHVTDTLAARTGGIDVGGVVGTGDRERG